MLRLYSLVWYLATPLIALWLAQLAFRDPVWRHGWRERFGLVRAVGRGGIWVHAASVGEVQAALRLVDALRMQYQDRPILLTTFTPSGRDHALRHLPNGVRCALLPFDFPGATQRFIKRARPRIGIIVETELWPNLYAACARARVPLIVVSARVTERGAVSYARWRSLIAATLQVPQVISAQSDEDAQRIQALGADPTRVTVGGNIKFDFQLPAGLMERAASVAEEAGITGRPAWIAASTHAGEEAAALEAHKRVLAVMPDAVLVLAPRHPGRSEEVAGEVQASGLHGVRRSEGGVCDSETQVYVVDTLGELAVFYGVAQVAFVGGTLVPVGGHNLLEPAAFSLPLLCGPHVQNIKRMHALLQREQAVESVETSQALGDAVARLLGNEAERNIRGKAARRVLDQNRGAVERIMHLVSGILPE